MKQKILIVEDEFIVANDLRMMLLKAEYEVCGIAASVDEAKSLLEINKPSLVLLDIFLQNDSMGTDLAEILAGKGIPFIYISASTNQRILEKAKATQPYGFLVKPFRKNDLLIMMDIAKEKHSHKLQLSEQRELMLKNQLELIAFSSLGTEERWNRIPAIFQSLLPFDFMMVTITRKRMQADDISIVRAGFDEYQLLKNQELKGYLGLTDRESTRMKISSKQNGGAKIYCGNDYLNLVKEDAFEKSLSERFHLGSHLYFPVDLTSGDSACLSFYSRNPENYKDSQLDFLDRITNQLIQLLESLKEEQNTTAEKGEKTVAHHKKPAAGNSQSQGFHGIIGNSPALVGVLDKVSLVAPAQSSVLILGESGTGKERIAQCIHQLSPRKGKPIVTVNCAALPKDLIESELFGHEKGAFTGALERRMGKFELANGGTIFLDEVGELPLDAQVKLLRVLQEKEVEYVGGNKPVKVNVRIITATNRQLEKEVADGRFRLDLYYRLNVFPIDLPPLRDRIADILLLAEYFIEKFSREMGRTAPTLSPAILKQLESHYWPGNIRELENLIERTLLLTPGLIIKEISLPVQVNKLSSTSAADSNLKTLEEMEADHILDILRRVKGKIGGSGGAAEILGLPPSTLNSKIKKLGIRRESYFNQ